MKIKGYLKGLLSVLALGLFTTSQAHAITLVAGHSYKLTGNIYAISTVAGYTQTYNLSPAGSLSYFTVNFDNTISVVLNLAGNTNGNRATLKIDKLGLSALTGTNIAMSAPANASTLSGSYKDVGNFFPVNNPTAFTNFGIAMNGKIDTAFHLWGAYFNLANQSLGGTDFHLTIGSDVTSQVPEPMSMSLLGMGLLGGVVSRRKRVAA